ncbi:hypothetical protein HD554DRAFT_2037289 [Boletus coccyginus]|nr:hypothetical protein HD554DRAFT_2037289 [Boletus coccyginus]
MLNYFSRLLGIALFHVTSLLRFSCTLIMIIRMETGASCTQQPVCCTNNNFNGLINLGCPPIDWLSALECSWKKGEPHLQMNNSEHLFLVIKLLLYEERADHWHYLALCKFRAIAKGNDIYLHFKHRSIHQWEQFRPQNAT